MSWHLSLFWTLYSPHLPFEIMTLSPPSPSSWSSVSSSYALSTLSLLSSLISSQMISKSCPKLSWGLCFRMVLCYMSVFILDWELWSLMVLWGHLLFHLWLSCWSSGPVCRTHSVCFSAGLWVLEITATSVHVDYSEEAVPWFLHFLELLMVN